MMPIAPQHDPLKPIVAGKPADDLIILMAKNTETGQVQSIRFHKKYLRRLVLDMLDIEESLEKP